MLVRPISLGLGFWCIAVICIGIRLLLARLILVPAARDTGITARLSLARTVLGGAFTRHCGPVDDGPRPPGSIPVARIGAPV